MSDLFLDPTALAELTATLAALRDQWSPPAEKQTPSDWIIPAPGLPSRPNLPAYSDAPPPFFPPGTSSTLRQVVKAVFGSPPPRRNPGKEAGHVAKVQAEVERQQQPQSDEPLVTLARPGESTLPSASPTIPPYMWRDSSASRPVLPTAVPNALSGVPPTPTRFMLPRDWLLELTPGNAMLGKLF